ncbi:hypothetical protein M0R72_18160 [Candidatus Pacearchaeota archaeon]|jgi:hypothetical protein|nr:hypothetical protein [Candidatus Pacearchaeota archaeon]
MPKDDWLKARQRDKVRRAGRQPGKPRSKKPMPSATQIASRFSLSSVLWFGQFKGRSIRDTPKWWLQWLKNQELGDNRPMAGLILFLRRNQASSVITRRNSPNVAIDSVNDELSQCSDDGYWVQSMADPLAY